MNAPNVHIRPARDDDAAALIIMIGACWTAYPGIVFDVDAELPELHAIASHFDRLDGRVWVAELDGVLVASIAIAPTTEDGAMELHKLYVDPGHRRLGLASRLMAAAEAEAAVRNAVSIELWTDTRFTDGQAFYERHGYHRRPGVRTLDDLSRTTEYGYFKRLDADRV